MVQNVHISTAFCDTLEQPAPLQTKAQRRDACLECVVMAKTARTSLGNAAIFSAMAISSKVFATYCQSCPQMAVDEQQAKHKAVEE